MRLYRLGEIPWQETQGIYHALAENGQEALVLCRPSDRYVCLGFHDDLQQEINIEYCRQNAIPLIRRETGGGVVLLDRNQLFFQLILRKDNPLLSVRRDRFFQTFLQPAVDTLRDYGLSSEIQNPADIVIKGRKISGNGAGDINGYAVYIGNILLDFDRQTMANVLNAPNDLFRQYTRTSMERHLTTLYQELGSSYDTQALEERLINHFSRLLPELKTAEYTNVLKQSAVTAAERLMSPEMLALPGRRYKARQVKIKENVYLKMHSYSDTLGGTGTAIMLIDNNIIRWVEMSGMECFKQKEMKALAASVSGIRLERTEICDAVLAWQKRCSVAIAPPQAEALSQWICEGIY